MGVPWRSVNLSFGSRVSLWLRDVLGLLLLPNLENNPWQSIE